MKKSILLFLVIGLFFQAKAQIKIGVQAGVLGSTIKATGDANVEKYGGKPKMQIGYKAGVFAEVLLGREFYFNQEINYVQLKGKNDNTTKVGDVEHSLLYKTQFSYMELPLNVVYKIPLENAGKIFFGAGPVLGYRVSEKTDYYYNTRSPVESTSAWYERRDIYQTIPISGNLLGGYEFPFGLKLSLQANHSLSNLDKRDNYKMQSTYLAFNAGYRF